ncbi:MAG: hypothetical protein ABEJ82_09560 [Haloplanus sp.]
MADVSRLLGDGDGRRDRAQLLLVGALALAVIFVVLSLLLNSVIYTENLATRKTNADADAAVEYRTQIRGGVGHLVEYANRDGDHSLATRRADFRATLADWRVMHSNYSALDGRATEVTLESTRPGTRIVDANASTSMTARDGTPTWWVARDVTVRDFRANVTVSTLADYSQTQVEGFGSDPTQGDVFRVVFDDGSPTTLAVYDDDTEGPTLLVHDAATGTTRTCPVTNGRVHLGDERVDGRYCRALSMVHPTGNADVRILDGGVSDGAFSLVVDRPESAFRTTLDTSNYGDQCTATYGANDTVEPYTTPAVYASDVRARFRTSDLTYGQTVRVAPGESGDPASEPAFVQFEVNETGSNDFSIDWNATDPDADLTSVHVVMYNVTDASIERSHTVTYGGVDAGNDSVLFPGLPNGSEYYVNVTATDAAGATRTVRGRYAPDGDDAGCPP